MAETHELRLKIDAAAAKAGSREFTAAVEAVKRAVRDLEKDSSGAFLKLQRNIKSSADALKGIKAGIDKGALRDLQGFAAAHAQIAKSASASEKSVKALANVVRGLAESYQFARGTADQFAAAILKTNSGLMRQIQLASQARSAVRQIGTAPTTTTAAPTSTKASPRGGEAAGLASGAAGGAKSVEAAQSIIQRSIATTRAQVESLTTSLMRLGGFGAMAQLHRDFTAFTAAASKAGVTTRELAAAKDRFATAAANARTSVTTLTAKTRDEARAAGEVASAEIKAAAAIKQRQAAQLAASGTIRQADAEAQRLTNRLREMGDTKSIHAVNQALISLKANLSGGAKSAHEIRAAMDSFHKTTSQVRGSVMAADAAQKQARASASALAAENRRVADSARAVEREMRSIAGANNAVSKSFRDATGSMRGLENAFSATFQAGSLFRTMLGSITVGTFVNSVFQAGDALDQFMVSMEVASGSAREAMTEIAYVDQTASSLGVDIASARANYAKFAVSASIAGSTAADTQKIFGSVATALSVMGKGTYDQNLAFMALEQMMSKGVVSSEELRQQLGERLPGAVSLMAEALGVSIQELQKLMKEGKLVSADVLPKFADKLMEKFGPGLENAMLRAGNNMQKLRNEITFFLEETAKSGFMQELAYQFRALTDTLASGSADGAARKFGEMLAQGARIGGEALQWLIENIETVGKVLKAVGVGLLVGQFAKMGQAVAMAATQMTGYIASWAAGSGGMTAAEIATQKHTLALTANTQALLANGATAVRTAGMTTTQVYAQDQLARSALTAGRSTTVMSGAVTAFGAAAGFASRAATLLSRVLSVVAPIATIAVTALLLIPGAMGSVGLEADNMGVKIDAALARSGAKFDEFGDAVRENTAAGMMNGLLDDLYILSGMITQIESQGAAGILAGWSDISTIEALTIATGEANLELGIMDKMLASFSGSATGIDGDDLTGASAGVAKDILLSYQKVKDGQMSVVGMQKQINNAIHQFPEDAPFFSVWKGVADQIAQAEQAIINTKQKLTELYGTSSEQTVVGFINMAEAVYRSGKGMDELKARQAEIVKTTPALAATLEEVMDSWNKSFARGDSSLAWATEIQGVYDKTAEKIMGLRAAANQANANFGTSLDTLQQKTAETMVALSDMGPNLLGFGGSVPVPEEVLTSYQTLIDQFAGFQSGGGLQVALDSLTLFTDGLVQSTPALDQFTTAVMNQFNALTPQEQTYQRLDTILRTTAALYPQLSSEVSIASSRILDHARAGNTAAMSYSDLESALSALPWPSDEARETALAVLDAAYSTQSLGNAADGATGSTYAAAGGMDAIGAGAAAASAQVRALQAALASLGAIAAGVPGAAAGIVDELHFQTKLKTSAVWSREMLSFEREQMKALDTARSEALATGVSGPVAARIEADYKAGYDAIQKGMTDIETASKGLYEAEAWKDPAKGGSGGGGKGGGGGKSDEVKAVEDLNKALKDKITTLAEEKVYLDAVSQSMFETQAATELFAQAMVAGGGAVDAQTMAMIKQIDVATKLNEELKKAARDPVKEWMDSVPSWTEAGKQIEMGAINSLKTTLSDFIKTGKFDLESLGESILGMVADIVADKAMKELMTLLGRGEPGSKGLGGLFGGLFSSVGDPEAPAVGGDGGMLAAAPQAGTTIGTAMTTAGQQVAMDIQSAMTSGGSQAGASVQGGLAAGSTNVRTAAQTGLATGSNNIRIASSTGGAELGRGVVTGAQQGAPILSAAVAGGAGAGGGGGMFSWESLLGMAIGAFSEGGMSNAPVGFASVSPSAFRNAPHFSQGTANTSGIPAMLHDNEAVIPLSRGRKIGVELNGDSAGGGSTTVVNQSFNIQTNDADSFRRSRKQVASDMATAGQAAVRQNR